MVSRYIMTSAKCCELSEEVLLAQCISKRVTLNAMYRTRLYYFSIHFLSCCLFSQPLKKSLSNHSESDEVSKVLLMLCPDMENSLTTYSLGQLSWKTIMLARFINVPFDNSGSLWHRSGVFTIR